MTEREQAIRIANRWLDSPPDWMGDPDCDPCIVGRQFLRALEEIEALRKQDWDALTAIRQKMGVLPISR